MAETTEQGDRLRRARERAGYPTAADAARAMGVLEPTYRHHENGTNKLSRAGERYARFFHIRYEWLMTGQGAMLDGTVAPVAGLVGAGATVDWRDDAEIDDVRIVELPDGAKTLAFIVKGDSQYPRFYEGEIVLVESQARNPADLIGEYAIVQTDDGRTLIKLVRRNGEGKYRLESHNAAPIEGVSVLFGHRYVGTLPRASALLPGIRPRIETKSPKTRKR